MVRRGALGFQSRSVGASNLDSRYREFEMWQQADPICFNCSNLLTCKLYCDRSNGDSPLRKVYNEQR